MKGNNLIANRIVFGDALTELRRLPTASIQCCVTSPPYWGLRDYGTATWVGGDLDCEHKYDLAGEGVSDKQKSNTGANYRHYKDECPDCGATSVDDQLGLEDTLEEYVSRMVDIFSEVRRILRKDGTLWLNLGDTYNGSGGAGLKPKDLCMIPARVALALQADGWWLRQDMIWAKPNPMPESVTDRCTKSHEYIFLLTKASKYYYDADAIREDYAESSFERYKYQVADHDVDLEKRKDGWVTTKNRTERKNLDMNPFGRNKRSVWTINTQAYPEAHFAVFPDKLPATCIMAGSSEKGQCSKCGNPVTRVVVKTRLTRPQLSKDDPRYRPNQYEGSYGDIKGDMGADAGYTETKTVGWEPTCKCNAAIVPQIILDPFVGSGTTAQVAKKLGRQYIGIELNPSYKEMIERRLAQGDLFNTYGQNSGKKKLDTEGVKPI